MPFTGENCHKQCVNQNFEFFILNSKAVLTFYSICNIFRNFEYTSYSICTIYFGNFNFFSYKRNPNSGKTKLACIVKRRKHYIYAILLISAACIDCCTQKDNRCPFWLHLCDLYIYRYSVLTVRDIRINKDCQLSGYPRFCVLIFVRSTTEDKNVWFSIAL